MKISYNWLNTFFDNSLPPVADVAQALTFHAWEVEDIERVGDDTVFEVKVLPDKTPYALSHRGIAKDLSVILGKPLSRDPLAATFSHKASAPSLTVRIESAMCNRYQAAVIRGVKVGPSPSWLRTYLTALGQRSINNIVDATNYVMFDIGQPLHAFDAGKLTEVNGTRSIVVRGAHEDERITTLTGEEYRLTPAELLIVDGNSDAPIGIAGIKGGKQAEVGPETTDIIIESANFGAVSTRKSSQRLKLRTDASQRFENGVVPGVTEPALKEVVELILNVAGGTFDGLAETPYELPGQKPVQVSLTHVHRVLGVPFDATHAREIIERFGYPYTLSGDVLTVTPPFERTDLVIPEDLIEELGRIHGYEHVPSVVPEASHAAEINKRFYYSEKVRTALTSLGFSEVYTSSFRDNDAVKLKNALASDKGYLRSSLRENLHDALLRNVPNRDLLGLSSIGIFEIGTVFTGSSQNAPSACGGDECDIKKVSSVDDTPASKNARFRPRNAPRLCRGDREADVFTAATETYALALGVRHGMEYREKTDKERLERACEKLGEVLGMPLTWNIADGIAELDLGALLPALPDPTAYDAYERSPITTFAPYSSYPAISRDIAFWVPESVSPERIATLITDHAGELLARLTLFDEFSKDGRTSYAFRLVFQSSERTLTDPEVVPCMEAVTRALTGEGYSVR